MSGTVKTLFWATSQNNSGGIFDHNPEKGVGYLICVEAVDREHAKARIEKVIDSYPASYDCPCCGDRWSIWLDDEGTEEPSYYDCPLTGGWGIPSYIHYLDGRIEPSEPMQHVAYYDEGAFHWMSGIAPRDCELFAKWPARTQSGGDV